MTEKEYSHDPHIWPITIKYPGMRVDEIRAATVILTELLLAKLETLVTAPPKPQPEPEGDADDLPDVR